MLINISFKLTYLKGTRMIESGKLLHDFKICFECSMLLSLHKRARINGIIEDRWVIAKGLFLQFHSRIAIVEWLQQSQLYCQCGYIPIYGSQTAFMENHPRLVGGLANCVRHLEEGF